MILSANELLVLGNYFQLADVVIVVGDVLVVPVKLFP